MPLANPEPRMLMRPPFTVEVANSPCIAGETSPRRNILSASFLINQPEGDGGPVETVFDIVKRSVRIYAGKPALGTRRLLHKHVETKMVKKIVDGKVDEVEKKWTMYEMGPYEFLTFGEYGEVVSEMGSALRNLGLGTGDKVHLFASTSAHWLAVAHGAMSQSMTIVTAYDTLGAEGLQHSLLATKARLIFLEPQLLKIFLSTLSSTTPNHIETIVYNTGGEYEITQEDLDLLAKDHAGIRVLSWETLRQSGADNPVDPVAPQGNDLACVMYTSGSTGTPKGVKLTHANIVAAVAGVQTQLGTSLHQDDSLLAYLPLAHIFEFVIEQIGFFFGIRLGYGSPRTLSDGSMKNCKGDIREFQPSVLVGVPAVWESVRKGVVAKVDSGSAVTRRVFWGALAAKSFLMQHSLPGSSLLDAIVFSKVREATGGRLRVCVTAAAPIARDTQQFLSMAIAPVINAYGMTETCGMGAICHPQAWTVDAVGAMEGCVEVKLVDYAEAGYFASGEGREQGEVWIRGPSVMPGYWGEEEGQEKDWRADGGWFKTGDIGEWDEKGLLRIIDRKKNLVKTLNGEYIALEKLESIYRSSSLVSNICVYASVTETHPIAMIVLMEPALKKLADALGVEGHGIADLILSPVIRSEILKQLQVIGRKAGFASMEILVGVVLADEEWTPANELVTATNKLMRRKLAEKYQTEIDEVYRSKR